MCTTFLNVILQNVQINTLQNLQNVNNAQNAKCKQCSGCKMCSLSRLQNVNNAAARVRPGFAQGSGSARVRSPYLWAVLTIARPTRARQRATGSNRPTLPHLVPIC